MKKAKGGDGGGAGGSNSATDFVAPLTNLHKALHNLKSKLRPLTETTREELASQVTKQEMAKLNAAMAYGISSLYYMLLRTKGCDTTDHGVKKELDRIKGAMGRLQMVKVPQRGIVVNVAAAQRFIKHGLAGNEGVDEERRAREQAAADAGAQQKAAAAAAAAA
ncbi:hypothetical protein JKP88DRAFT_266346, partial [Tribonema minus]